MTHGPRQKSVLLAAVLSFVLPGTGQIYAGRIVRGLLFLSAATVLAFTRLRSLHATPSTPSVLVISLVSLVLRLIAVADAIACTRSWNTRLPEGTPTAPGQSTLLWIIWSAFAWALLIYALVGWMIQTQPTPQLPEWLSPPVLIGGLVFLAAADTLLLFIGPLAASDFAAKNSYEAYSVIRWALAESTGIYGLVIFLLARSWVMFGILLVCAFILLLRLMPTQTAYQRYCDLGGGRGTGA